MYNGEVYFINGVEVKKGHFYRIRNKFEGDNNSFWYEFSSDKTELNSICKNERSAMVYTAEEIEKNATLIRNRVKAKLIEV